MTGERFDVGAHSPVRWLCLDAARPAFRRTLYIGSPLRITWRVVEIIHQWVFFLDTICPAHRTIVFQYFMIQYKRRPQPAC